MRMIEMENWSQIKTEEVHVKFNEGGLAYKERAIYILERVEMEYESVEGKLPEIKTIYER
jgi:hypothetical protein